MQLYLAATSATKITVQERVTTATYSQVSGMSIFSSMPEPVPRDSAIIEEFAKWFYNRVNQPGGLVPEDFWPDANINLIVKRKTDSDYKAAQGGKDVVSYSSHSEGQKAMSLYYIIFTIFGASFPVCPVKSNLGRTPALP